MNILITGTTGESMPPPYGGVPKLSLLIAGAWKKEGHKVAITFPYRPVNEDDLGADAEYFFEYSGKPNKFRKVIFLLRYFFASPILYFVLLMDYLRIYQRLSFEVILYSAYGVFLNKAFSVFRPDIVLAEAALIKTFMAAKIAKYRRVPIVFDTYAEIHDLSIGANKWLNEKERKKYWEKFLDLADFVITPGPYCSRGPLKYLPKEKVDFVYDGSDYKLLSFDLSSDRRSLRDSLSLPQDLFLVGSVGAFEFRKGHDHLIQAIARLSREGQKVGVVICGGSGNPGKWKDLAKREGMEERLFIFNRISEIELARVYKSLDLYCELENTPRSCGFTMSILEAMAMGLPIVIYDNKDMLEAIQGGKNGLAVPMNDIEALSLAILKIYQMSSEKRQIMGSNCSSFARKIDINFTANRKMDLFKRIINNFNKTV